MAVPITFFLASAAIIITFMFLYYSTRHKERMSLIESGRSASIFEEKAIRHTGSSALKYGLFLVFIGVGVFFGICVEDIFRMPEASGIIPSILISGGLALLLYYKMIRKEEAEQRLTKDHGRDTV